MTKYFLSVLWPLLTLATYCQDTAGLRSNRRWNAQWIAINNPLDRGTDYGVFYFRKVITLHEKPSRFIIHISADNHYKLYINGKLNSTGPTRGDLHNWHYETIDIAASLQAGANTVAAEVWNEGAFRPEYQISLHTGFVIQGNTAVEEALNTNKSWKCIEDKSFQPVWGYFLSINGESVDMNRTINGWYAPGFDDSAWPAAAALWDAQPKGFSDGFGYMLVPSGLPPMEMSRQAITVVRRVTGIDGFATFGAPLTIPANKKVVILLDQIYETNAYPTLVFSGGRGAGLSLGYAESLYLPGSNFRRKGNRNAIEGMDFRGLTDTILSNGQAGQSFTPFNFRTYRYMQLVVQTKEDALTIDSLYGTFTAYPFKAEAAFISGDTAIKQLLDIGWRTARLNAYDNYFTGQYYERLQYIGDARIQAMISYYYSSDNRLTRNALEQIDESRLPEGITLSRYPTQSTQVIPTFSLLYIGMLHDYWMYRDDPEFVKSKLAGVRAILGFFGRYQQSDGSLHGLPFWNFMDWADGKGWDFGVPPRNADGESAILDMLLLQAYQWAAEMESRLGLTVFSARYRGKASELRQTIRHKYWDGTKGLYADTRDRLTFSQHANALALLSGVVPEAHKPAFSKRLIGDSSLAKCSMYFSYYLHQALIKGGLGDDYMKWLDPWRESIRMGLTTWAEEPNLSTTRSDCHAWASGPNVEFFRTVLGIDSYSPGFKTIKIEPHVGTLTRVSGKIPHPDGEVAVSYVLGHNKWEIRISIPRNTSGVLRWKGISYPLKGGENSFVVGAVPPSQ